MNFRKLLMLFGTTSCALMAMTSASAAEIIKLDSSNAALVKSIFSNLTEVKTNIDHRGNVHTRYAQQYNGIPVYGHQIIKHDRINAVAAAPVYSGDYVKGLAEDVAGVKAELSSAAALATAKQLYLSKHASLKTQELVYDSETSKLVYFLDANQKAHLAYLVNFFVDTAEGGEPARPYYILDAKTAAVLSKWNGLTTDKVGTGPGGNEKTGQRNYDGTTFGMLDVKVDATKNSCTMTTANVNTVHMKNRRVGGRFNYSFTCFESNNDAANGAFSPANDAHYFGGVIFGMYSDWYNTAPITTALTMRVHYGRQFENAFWDGKAMSFGDGATMFYPLVSLDVAGHEVSHGFTEQNSGLEYQSQSGGINESFSDIAGKAAEFYMYGSNSDWTVGEEIFKADGALRYMDQPSKDGSSIDTAQEYYDGLDVHYSSGVFNRAFYLLATSSSYTTKTAFDLMVHANQNYWQAESDYQDAANGVLMAANDLGYDPSAVIAAFATVGITLS